MGSSGWSYVTAYRGDVTESLRELRERTFRDKEYYWWDDFEEDEPRPATMDGLWASEEMRNSLTHSILDVDRVLDTTAPPDPRSLADFGTVRPLAADRVLHHFGTDRPTRDQFTLLAEDPTAAGHREFIGELTVNSAGLYILLYDGGEPTGVGFWGYSGD